MLETGWNIHCFLDFQLIPRLIPIHIQWIPSHVSIGRNEIAYSLAKAASLEIPSLIKKTLNDVCNVSPAHDWYAKSQPGGALLFEAT